MLINPNEISGIVTKNNSSQLTYSFNSFIDNLTSFIFPKIENIIQFIYSLPSSVGNFCDNHILVIGIMTGIIVGLLVGSPWIRFKVEKKVRDFFFLPLLEVNLKSKQIHCKDGLVLLHGISLRNKMWFTNTIPVVFCSTKTTLNWAIMCNHIGTMWDGENQLYSIDEFIGKLKQCLLEQTRNGENRNIDIYRTAHRVLYILVEKFPTDTEVPLNEINSVGQFYLNTRNLMPELKVGWKETLHIGSYDFGLIETFNLEIPENLLDKKNVSESELYSKHGEKCLTDVGIILRYPLRLNVYRRKNLKLFIKKVMISKKIKPAKDPFSITGK